MSEIIELKNVAVLATQITGIGKVTYDRKRFGFWVDVPGNRYMQIYSSDKEAREKRQALIDKLQEKKPKKVAKKVTENENPKKNETDITDEPTDSVPGYEGDPPSA